MTSVEFLPRGQEQGYEPDVFAIATYFKTKAIWGKTANPAPKFYVYVEYVFGNTMPHTPIQGVGSTFNDACMDYMRQVRGMELLHIINNKVGTFV